jgi:hypothetical protein
VGPFRSRIALIALFALACQAAFVSMPLAGSVRADLLGEHGAKKCTCGLAGHENAICPMHHSPAGKPRPAGHHPECRMSNAASTQADFVLAAGVLPEPPPFIALPVQRLLPSPGHTSPLLTRSAALDPPPPRL